MTARAPKSISNFRLNLDKLDKLETGIPDLSDLVPYYDTSEGYAKATTPEALSTGIGQPTAVITTPTVLTSTQSAETFTNEGASAQIEFDLPTAVAGLRYTFIVQDIDGIKIVAATGDTIRNGGVVSDSAGYIESTTIGSVITLLAINATEWLTIFQIGDWFVDA